MPRAADTAHGLCHAQLLYGAPHGCPGHLLWEDVGGSVGAAVGLGIGVDMRAGGAVAADVREGSGWLAGESVEAHRDAAETLLCDWHVAGKDPA